MEQTHNPGDGSILRDYLNVLRRRKLVFLLALVLVPLTAVLLAVRQQPLYQASAEVLLNNNDLAASLTGTASSIFFQDPVRIADTQAQLARVPSVAQRVVDAANVRGRTGNELLAESSVTAEQNADLLQFSVTDPSPAIAARLATEYARQFTIYRRHLDTAAIVSARGEVARRLQELLRSGDRNSSLYATLAEKEQQLRTLEALKTANATVVRSADAAAKIRPRPVRSGVLGVLIGVLLGLALAFLWETLDTRVRSAGDVSGLLHIPLLARLPVPRRKMRRKHELVMLAAPNSHDAEAFRMLRTNLEFVNLERDARTIMVTSALEREGKTTTVANLAVALARSGQKVALVDLDLRRPFVDRFFDLGGRPGVTDVALGHVPLTQALAYVAVSGDHLLAEESSGNGHGSVGGALHVLTAGSTPPNPGEFVGSHRLEAILHALAEKSDVVLIDSPPMLHVGDAMTLTGRVDAIVLVVRLKVVSKPMLTELQRLLSNAAATPLGFVLAGAEGEAGYGYVGSYYRDSRTADEPVRVHSG